MFGDIGGSDGWIDMVSTSLGGVGTENRYAGAGAGLFSTGNALAIGLDGGPITPVQVGTDAASEAICGNPSAEALAGLIQIGLGALAMLFMLKGIYRLMSGMDKRGSQNQKEVQEGRNLIKGAGMSFGAALAPGLGFAVITAAGFGVIQCLVPDSVAMIGPYWALSAVAAAV